MKSAHGIFKKSPARKSDYLAANDIKMMDDVSERFPLKFCGHRWLENGKVLTRFFKVIEMMVKILREFKAAKKFPTKTNNFLYCCKAQHRACFLLIMNSLSALQGAWSLS